MKVFKALVKVQLKDYLSKTVVQLGGNSTGLLGMLIVPLLMLIFLVVTVQISYGMYTVFTSIGQPQLVITMMYIAASVFILFLSLAALVSIFYFATDTSLLAALPITERSIVFSKLSVQYLFSFIIAGLCLAPAMVFTWVGQGVTLISVVYSILLLVLTPLLPLLLATLIVLVGMHFISKSVNRNTLTVVMGLIFVIAMFGLQIFVNRQLQDPEIIQQIFLKDQGLLHLLGARFYPSIWATQMSMGSTLNAVYFLLLNALLVVGIAFSARFLFRSALQSMSEGQTRRKGKRTKYSRQAIMRALVRRQLLIISKTPTFLLNTIMLLLLPFILVVFYVSAGIVELRQIMEGPLRDYGHVMLGLLLLSPSVLGSLSATAITREGRNLWQLKVLPLSPLTDLNSRVLTTILVNLLGMVPLFIGGIYVLSLGPLGIWLGLLMGLIGTVALAYLDIIIDIHRPILNWNTPSHAVKNNLNVIVSLGLRVAVGIVVYLTRNLWRSWPMWAWSLGLSGLFTLLLATSLIYIKRRGVDVYAKLEL